MLSHAIIIRLFFAPDDPRAAWRLAFFEAMTLPCLQRQADPDFEIWISAHPAHHDRLRAMDQRITPFCSGPQREDAEIGLIALAGDGDSLPRFAIQTRLDSDDLVAPGFVAKIREVVAQADPAWPLVVSFQPYKLDLSTLQRYRLQTKYHERCCSMFLSLYQPENWAAYRYIYEFNHRLIWEIFPKVATIPAGFCDLVVHGGNCHTKIEKKDKLLK